MASRTAPPKLFRRDTQYDPGGSYLEGACNELYDGITSTILCTLLVPLWLVLRWCLGQVAFTLGSSIERASLSSDDKVYIGAPRNVT